MLVLVNLADPKLVLDLQGNLRMLAHRGKNTWDLTLKYSAKRLAEFKNLRYQAHFTCGAQTVRVNLDWIIFARSSDKPCYRVRR